MMNSSDPASVRSVTAAGKAKIVRGVIHGLLQGRWNGGDRLTEIETAELFRVSRTPVREALLELAAMGMVELRRNCGAVFYPFGVKELVDLYAVRALLEVEAASLAATRIDETTVDSLIARTESLRRQKKPDKDWRLDRELHAAIARASNNPRLAGEISRYAELVQTMREAVGRSSTIDIHSTSQGDHLRILRSLKQRDSEAAASSMRRHLDQASSSATKTLTRLRSKLATSREASLPT
jgi:DNA-binding GntR family transcriptional regulator